jgi:hypothetical protein
MPNMTLFSRSEATQMRKEAIELMKQARDALVAENMRRSYHLYGDAISRLQVLWDASQSQDLKTGALLAKAYVDGCYSAHRQFYNKRKPLAERQKWLELAFDRERRGVDIELLLARLRTRSEKSVVGTLCLVHNLATDLLHYGINSPGALHYLNEGYGLSKLYWPEMPMHVSMLSAFKTVEALYQRQQGNLHSALDCADQAVAAEQWLVDYKRKQHKKAPPSAWLKKAEELRKEIETAIGTATE